MILLSLDLVGLQNRYASKDNAMKKVQAGDHVIIEYEGMLEDDVIVESSSDNGPCEFEVGAGFMPPGFEKALIGMVEGEEKSVILPRSGEMFLEKTSSPNPAWCLECLLKMKAKTRKFLHW
jgi:hypothetical protein